MSVRSEGTNGLPLNRFLRNVVLAFVTKICRENPGLVKIGRYAGMRANVRNESVLRLIG